MSTKSLFLLFTIHLLLLFGQASFSQARYNDAVIIFKNYSPVEKEHMGEPRFYTNIPEILYWDHQKGDEISPSGTKDTVNITMQDPVILLRHRYNVSGYCDFLFAAGDSIIINYINGFPFPEVINRPCPESEFKVDWEIKQRFIKGKFDPVTLYQRAETFRKGQDVELFRKKTSVQIKAFLKNQSSLLDSLYGLKKISDMAYSFYKERIAFQNYSLEVNEGSLTKNQAITLIRKENPAIYPERYLNEFIDQYVQKYIFKSFVSKDPRADYQKILSDTAFTVIQKNRLLGRLTRQIIAVSSNTDAIGHFEKFKNDIQDPLLTERIFNQYKNKLSIKNTDYELLSFNNLQPVRYENLVKKNKYTYIDFWASWCAPCIAEMPSSKKLIARYSGKDIGFIYISIDGDKDKWEKLVHKLDLGPQRNFLIADNKTSRLLDFFSIKQIPRYILVNYEGKIIHSDAARPSDPELSKILDLLVN